jgi:hypothetical protein
MDYRLNVSIEAREDIIEGFKWYEDKWERLGSEFIVEVERVLNYISTSPELF